MWLKRKIRSLLFNHKLKAHNQADRRTIDRLYIEDLHPTWFVRDGANKLYSTWLSVTFKNIVQYNEVLEYAIKSLGGSTGILILHRAADAKVTIDEFYTSEGFYSDMTVETLRFKNNMLKLLEASKGINISQAGIAGANARLVIPILTSAIALSYNLHEYQYREH